jgi:spermidine/putrescine transport system substrate-binding protein
MDALDTGLYDIYPNLLMAPEDLLKNEQLRDLGQAQKAYSRAVTEIKASQ